MKIDSKLARILSSFCLDIAKAAFIGTFIGGSFAGQRSFAEVVIVLTKAIFGASLFIIASWQFAKLEESYE